MRCATTRPGIAVTLIAVAAVVALALALGGCGPLDRDSTGSRMPASAADPQTVQRIRDKYVRAYPESQLGVVIATLRDKPFVAVGDLPALSSLREGEVVTFLDRSERVLTTGTVAAVRPAQLDVRVDPPRRGGREPRRGDIAILRLPAGASTL